MALSLPPGVTPGGRYDSWPGVVPRYAVADVDGTLVGSHAAAAPRVVNAVAAAQQAGLRVGFATGRMRLAVEPLHVQLGAEGPHVLHNGAEVRASGTTIASWPLTPAQVGQVLELAERRGRGYVEIYVREGYHVTTDDPRARPHWELLGRPPLSVGADLHDLDEPVLKATFAIFDGDSDGVVAELTALGLRAGAAGSPLTPDIGYVNANHPDADKGRALRRAAEHLDVDTDAVVAIGDAPNDLPMFAVAGTSIAMGQSPGSVKDAAHLVVPSVAEDGVATALDACVAWLRSSSRPPHGGVDGA